MTKSWTLAAYLRCALLLRLIKDWDKQISIQDRGAKILILLIKNHVLRLISTKSDTPLHTLILVLTHLSFFFVGLLTKLCVRQQSLDHCPAPHIISKNVIENWAKCVKFWCNQEIDSYKKYCNCILKSQIKKKFLKPNCYLLKIKL